MIEEKNRERIFKIDKVAIQLCCQKKKKVATKTETPGKIRKCWRK